MDPYGRLFSVIHVDCTGTFSNANVSSSLSGRLPNGYDISATRLIVMNS